MKQDRIVRGQGGGRVKVVQGGIGDLGIEPSVYTGGFVRGHENVKRRCRLASIRRGQRDRRFSTVSRSRGSSERERDGVER